MKSIQGSSYKCNESDVGMSMACSNPSKEISVVKPKETRENEVTESQSQREAGVRP